MSLLLIQRLLTQKKNSYEFPLIYGRGNKPPPFVLHLDTNSRDAPLHTPPRSQGDGFRQPPAPMQTHDKERPPRSYHNRFPLLASADQAATSDDSCVRMDGSGPAVVQASEASRNTAPAGQMVPEAQASRTPVDCSSRVSPRPGRGRTAFARRLQRSRPVPVTTQRSGAVSRTNTATLPGAGTKKEGTKGPQE